MPPPCPSITTIFIPSLLFSGSPWENKLPPWSPSVHFNCHPGRPRAGDRQGGTFFTPSSPPKSGALKRGSGIEAATAWGKRPTAPPLSRAGGSGPWPGALRLLYHRFIARKRCQQPLSPLSSAQLTRCLPLGYTFSSKPVLLPIHPQEETAMTLDAFFREHPRFALAFSGGTDSAYLLWAAVQAGVPGAALFCQDPLPARL